MSQWSAWQGIFVAGLLVSAVCGQSRPASAPAAFDPAQQLTYSPADLAAYEVFLAPVRGGKASELPLAEGTPTEQATVYLARANGLLAVPTGRAATRWLIGMDVERDRELISLCGRAAQEYVKRAKASLKAAKELPKDEKRRLQDIALTLEAFVELFAVAADGVSASTYRRAGHKLAVVGEDANPAVAACGQLWQAFAWELAGRRERAMASLPGALKKPSEMPYDFLSRLLRCRIVVEADQPVAATALAVRIRGLCDAWFSSEKKSRSAGRLAALLQYRATQAWLDDLGDSDPQASDRLRRVLAEVKEELFPADTEHDVYYLEEAVPILITEPKPPTTQPAATATAPASAPATQPVTTSTSPAQ